MQPDDGVQPPVRHVDELVVDDEGEGVPDHPGADGLDVGAVQLGVLDVVEERVAPTIFRFNGYSIRLIDLIVLTQVAPVEPVVLVVHGEAVGPAQENVAEDLDVGAVAVGPADVGGPVPLGVEDVAL